jgi:hypothetical protein
MSTRLIVLCLLALPSVAQAITVLTHGKGFRQRNG